MKARTSFPGMKLAAIAVVALASLAWSAALAQAQTTYTWNQTGTASWTTASNWTPTRTTPATNDILVFSNGATTTVTGVPTQTVGRISVSGNTTVNLQAGAALNTLTIAGDPSFSPDLLVDINSALNVNGANALTIMASAGADGVVGGNMTFSAAAHKLDAASASGITFISGAIFTQGTGCTGNVFTNTGTANAIVFASGSRFHQAAGANPFGLSAPSSKVVFQTGSLFRMDQNSAPSFSGRTYANFQVNTAAFSQSATGTGGTSIDDLTMTAGTLNLNLTGANAVNIKGNLSVASGATLNFNPASAGNLNFSGTTSQSVTNSGTLTFAANEAINVTNAGFIVTLNSPLTFNGTTTINSGSLLATAATLTNSGTMNVNGAFQINQGGFAAGNNFVYGASATLVFNNTAGSYGVNSGHVYWPSSNGPHNVYATGGGGITMNVARTVNGIFRTTGGVINGNNLTFNGTAQIATGGYFSGSPTYGGSSTLDYTSGGTYGRGDEWTSTSGAGYPNNVELSSFTVLDLGNGGPGTARQLAGNLVIGTGSELSMSVTPMTATLTVLGQVTNLGTLTLSTASGGDLVVHGSFIHFSTFNANNRAVFFRGSGNQQVQKPGGITIPYVRIEKSGGAVQMNSNLTITGPSGGNGLEFNGTSDELNLNGNTLTLEGASLGGTNASGGFRGSATSNLVVNGMGPYGPVRFVSGGQSLGNLTINRNSGSVTLGTDLTVNGTLLFSDGKLATGSNTIFVASSGTVSGASSTRYVNGKLNRRVPISAGVGNQTWDIGDATRYTPVSLFTNTGLFFFDVTFSSTGSEHPNIGTSGIDASKSVNRYYTGNQVLTSGGFSNVNLTFNFDPADVDGGANTNNFVVKKYNSPNWTATGTGTRTATSTEATGITSFSDFAIGEANTHTITTTFGPNGSITPSGAVVVPDGGSQKFDIVPDPCYRIASVLLDGSQLMVPPQGPMSIEIQNVTTDHTLHATFAINTYQIMVTAHPGGDISPGTSTVNCGDDITFTITPADECTAISDVLVDGVSVGPVTSYTFTNVQASHTIEAFFDPLGPYTITASAGTGGTITPSGPVSVPCGASQTFSIAADACYVIADVLVDNVSVGPVSSYTFTDVQANHTISATFTQLGPFTITASGSPGGSISPAGSVPVNCGDSQTFQIAADPCYAIYDVVVDGNSVGPVSSYTFTNVQANHTIQASFTQLGPYPITATAGPGGFIAPSGTINVPCGGGVTFSIIPQNKCFVIADVVVDGNSVGPVSTYSFNDVQAAHTIHATFTQLGPFTISAGNGPGGSITPSGNVSVACGANQTFQIAPNACNVIYDVVVDGNSVGPVTSYTFTDVQANHTIFAHFQAAPPYTITATAGPGGSISPDGSVSVTCGADQTFNITADPCYAIADVRVDGSSVGPVSSYTFTNVQANHTISASFMPLGPYTITASAGSGGSITPSGAVSVACGADQTFSIAADPCYVIADVVVDGNSVGPVSTYTFTNVQANHTISASFTPIGPYTITATAGAGGSISPNGAVAVACGSDQTFTIAPLDKCYVIADVVVDGNSVGPVSSYTFTNVQANHTIHATFSQLGPFTITATAGTGGTITPNGAVSVPCGGSQSFTIVGNVGYIIADVKVDGSSVGATGSYTFNDVQANHTIEAFFADIMAPSVTVIEPNGGENILVGTTTKLEWSATDNSGSVADIDLYISRDNGATWEKIASDIANTGTYTWLVTGPGTNTGFAPEFTALFRVDATDAAGNPGTDASDAPFSIYDLATETMVSMFQASSVGDGIELRWRIAESELLTDVLLERSESEAGPWFELATERRVDDDVTVMTDRTVQPERTYYYRLIGVMQGQRVVLGQLSGSARMTLRELALAPVVPNPSRGLMRVEYTLPRESRVRLSIVDVQGREVAVLADGVFNAGQYQTAWSGRTERGTAPAGIYFVRYQALGRNLTQRIVRTR